MIGDEARAQALEKEGVLPERVIACVGGGSNAIGTFTAFVPDEGVALIGVEAAGDGVETGRHGASLSAGRTSVLHGSLSAVIADDEGQILEAHSVSAGLDYPGVGPEHAWLRDTGRASYVAVTDRDALCRLPRAEPAGGHHPGARDLPRDRLAAGRRQYRRGRLRHRLPLRPGRQGPGRGARPERALSGPGPRGPGPAGSTPPSRPPEDEGRAALMPYMMGGFPDPETSTRIALAYADAGADLIELGVPFSDPLADGPVIHAAATAALEAGARLARPCSRSAAGSATACRWC